MMLLIPWNNRFIRGHLCRSKCVFVFEHFLFNVLVVETFRYRMFYLQHSSSYDCRQISIFNRICRKKKMHAYQILSIM